MKKVCFKCNIPKDLSEYYKHEQMADGHLNKCKKCTISDSKIRTNILTSTVEGLEKERKRHRDKYQRLNYKEAQKIWDKDKPWKNSAIYKGLSKKHKTPKGFEIHHWNYNDGFLENFFILQINEHKKAHLNLKLDIDKRIFINEYGVYLDTK